MDEILKNNITNLQANNYPGRGIIIGMTPDASRFVQVYWIMGRSKNSRNRIFVLNDNYDVKNKAFDEKELVDPSLIIYTPIRSLDKIHIISNGDQTDTIYNQYCIGGSFEQAINEREYEPDEPNYTPRISGVVDLNGAYYKLSIIKSLCNTSKVCIRNIFCYSNPVSGIGHCITTYMGDGNPLPSYEGEPYILPLHNNINETLDYYWNLLNEENRISILVKHIHIETNEISIEIKNKLRN